MYIERLIVKGYKILENLDVGLNKDTNIFIGEKEVRQKFLGLTIS